MRQSKYNSVRVRSADYDFLKKLGEESSISIPAVISLVLSGVRANGLSLNFVSKPEKLPPPKPVPPVNSKPAKKVPLTPYQLEAVNAYMGYAQMVDHRARMKDFNVERIGNAFMALSVAEQCAFAVAWYEHEYVHLKAWHDNWLSGGEPGDQIEYAKVEDDPEKRTELMTQHLLDARRTLIELLPENEGVDFDD